MQHLLSIGSHMSPILLVGESFINVNLFVDIQVHTSMGLKEYPLK